MKTKLMALVFWSVVTVFFFTQTNEATEKLDSPQTVSMSMIDEAALNSDLNPRFFRAMLKVESTMNPAAKNYNRKHDASGGLNRLKRDLATAWGLGQVMGFNFKRCKLPSVDHLKFSIQDNLNCAAQILSEEMTRYRNKLNALRAYNGGHKCVVNRCPDAETYAAKVMQELATNIPATTWD